MILAKTLAAKNKAELTVLSGVLTCAQTELSKVQLTLSTCERKRSVRVKEVGPMTRDAFIQKMFVLDGHLLIRQRSSRYQY